VRFLFGIRDASLFSIPSSFDIRYSSRLPDKSAGGKVLALA
jgi:hypothetical protein